MFLKCKKITALGVKDKEPLLNAAKLSEVLQLSSDNSGIKRKAEGLPEFEP
jgi:hypothetical protein